MKVRLLPYERFEITTSLSPEEVERRLKENTEPRNWFRLFGGEKIFEGNIDYPHFQINRILWYEHPSPIFFYGEIINEGKGSRISLVMKPHFIHLIGIGLFLAWSGFFALVLLSDLIAYISSQQSSQLSDILIGYIIIILLWGLIEGRLLYESSHSKNAILKILEK